MEVTVMNARKWLEENKGELVAVFRWVGHGFWKEIDPAEIEEEETIEEIETVGQETWLYLDW
jgi:hypothetical protein